VDAVWNQELRFADSMIELVGSLYRYHQDAALQKFVVQARQQYCQQVSNTLTHIQQQPSHLLKSLGYPDRSCSPERMHQTMQQHFQQEEQETLKKLEKELNCLVPPLYQPLWNAHQLRIQLPELAQALNYYVPLDGQPLSNSPESDRKVL
jgi:hypothetical protein